MQAAGKIVHENRSVILVALSDNERRHELCFGIDGKVSPDIADLVAVVADADVRLLLADESPNLVNLDARAWQVDHFLIKDCLACFTNANAKAHDRVAVNAGHAFNAADAVALGEGADDRCLLFGGKNVCHVKKVGSKSNAVNEKSKKYFKQGRKAKRGRSPGRTDEAKDFRIC